MGVLWDSTGLANNHARFFLRPFLSHSERAHKALILFISEWLGAIRDSRGWGSDWRRNGRGSTELNSEGNLTIHCPRLSARNRFPTSTLEVSSVVRRSAKRRSKATFPVTIVETLFKTSLYARGLASSSCWGTASPTSPNTQTPRLRKKLRKQPRNSHTRSLLHIHIHQSRSTPALTPTIPTIPPEAELALLESEESSASMRGALPSSQLPSRGLSPRVPE